MQNELLSEGLTLMLAGMGTVFVFLTVLVIAMTLMSKLVGRLTVAAHGLPTWGKAAPTGADDEIAAIAAAITEHRRK
jgi:oxaloacetate decarboxylase (Na+ extruding) subunit gamma